MRREQLPRVAIVSEIRLYRDALERELSERGVDVVPLEAQADVILVDVAQSSGLATLRRLTESAPETRLIALAVRDDDTDVLACIEAGAVGYVLRQASIDELTDATRRALRDEPLASPHVIATLMRRVAHLSASADPASFSHLTTRERQVAELIEQGLSNKEIAAQLSIAVTTVKNHVHSILEKLKVHRRGEAASLVRNSDTNRQRS